MPVIHIWRPSIRQPSMPSRVSRTARVSMWVASLPWSGSVRPKAVSDAVNRQGVQFMVSGWHSSVAMAVSEAESGMNIVHIGHGGESQYICEKINKDPEKYRHWFKGWRSEEQTSELQ